MWAASVEGDSFERLNVLRDDGDIGGKPLLAFISGLIAHLDGHDDDWFIRLESEIHESVDPLAKPLQQAICGIEEIDTFREDEYEFFRHRHPNPDQWTPKTEDEFKKQRLEFFDKFVEIDVLRASVGKLIDILKTTLMEAEDGLYDPVDTMTDLVGLDQALELLAQRGAETALIRFA